MPSPCGAISRARWARRCAIVGQAHPVKGILMSTSVARLTSPEGPGYDAPRNLTPIAMVGFWWPRSPRVWHTDEVTPLSPRPSGPGLAAS